MHFLVVVCYFCLTHMSTFVNSILFGLMAIVASMTVVLICMYVCNMYVHIVLF